MLHAYTGTLVVMNKQFFLCVTSVSTVVKIFNKSMLYCARIDNKPIAFYKYLLVKQEGG
jgi:hypothetical protein